jgi:uncharacterized repeat protein (TIGR01451 family)
MKEVCPGGNVRNRSCIAHIFFLCALTGLWLAQGACGQELDHFAWTGVPTSIGAGQPLAVVVRAEDLGHRLLTNFSGSVSLSVLVPGQSPNLLISEVQAGSLRRVEFSNVSTNAVDISGWRVVCYDSLSWPSPKGTMVVPAGTICPGSGIFQVDDGTAGAGAFPFFSAGVPLSWSTSGFNNPIGVLLLDPAGQAVDCFFALDAYPALITVPVSVTDKMWGGPTVGVTLTAGLTYQRLGHINSHSGADWVVGTNSFGRFNPRLDEPFVAPLTGWPLVPATLTLSNGIWSGEIRAPNPGTNLVLRADDGRGNAGDSQPITVLGMPALSLQIPHEGSKANPGLVGQGTIRVPGPVPSDLVVALTSSFPSQVLVSSAVTIGAGRTSAVFGVTNLDNRLVEGPQVATISATAPGFAPGNDWFTNYDRPPVTISVVLPNTVFELDGWLKAGAVTSSVPVAANVRVQLYSSNPGKIRVPDFTIILAGNRSASFGFAVIDNLLLDGNQQVTISDSVPGWTSGSSQLTVRDNETANLVLALPFQVNEGGGILTNAGTIRIAGILETNLEVTLANDAADRLGVPLRVVIPAGQSSSTFDLAVPNDGLVESNALANITASATGFNTARRTVTIVDAGMARFLFATLPPTGISGRPLGLTISALNLSGGVAPGYSGTAALRATNAAGAVRISPSLIGPFTNGAWSGYAVLDGAEHLGVTLIAVDGSGHLAASMPFDALRVRDLGLPVSDMAYDPVRGWLWAGIQSGSGTNSLTLSAIDPLSGEFRAQINLGAQPGALALSGDSQFLYIGLTPGGVVRADLSNHTLSGLFDWPFSPGTIVSEMAVLPGDPRTMVAQLAGATVATVLYRDGVLQTNSVGPTLYQTDYHLAGYSGPTNLYSVYPGGVRWLNVVSNGLTVIREDSGPQYAGSFVSAGGLFFSSLGAMVEPRTFRQLGAYPASGLVAADANAGEVFFLAGSTLKAFDLPTFSSLGQMDVPLAADSALKMVRCGSNLLAISSSLTNLLLVQTALVRQPATADLSVMQSAGAETAVVGSNFTYSVTIHNGGPESATNVAIVDVLPADTLLVTATSTGGTCSVTNGLLDCALGSLAPGASVTIRVTLQPLSPGQMVNSAWVTGDGLNLANNATVLTNTVKFGPVLPAVTRIGFSCDALVYDASRNCLWATTERFGGALDYSLHALSLSDGLLGPAIALGYPSSLIALSADQNYLYAVYINNQDGLNYTPDNFIKRANLGMGAVDQDFPVLDRVNQQESAVDLIGISSYPSGVLVAKSQPQLDVSLYHNGAILLNSPNDAGGGVMEINPAIPSRCYRLVGGYGGGNLARLQIGPGAITLLDSANLFAIDPSSNDSPANDMKFGGGFLFADNGMVVNAEAMTRVGRLSAAGLVESDPAQGQVFYLCSASSGWVLKAFDTASLRPLWTAAIPGVSGTPGSLTRCGAGLLSFRTTMDQLFLVNTLILATTPVADLAVYEEVNANLAALGSPVIFTATVTNAGPGRATGVRISASLPVGATLVSLVASQGTCTNDNGQLLCQVGTLQPGDWAKLTVTVLPTAGGTLTMLAAATLDEDDPNPANNSSGVVTYVPETTPDGIRTLDLASADLAYDPIGRKLFFSVPSSAALYPNTVMSFDPVSGAIGTPVAVGKSPGKVALSDDGQFLYVAANGDSAVTRLRLNAQGPTPDLYFSIGNPFQIQDMAVLPGTPHAVAIDRLNVSGSPVT